MDDLLKDAIADAKAVRETALANAKLALEEAFTPRIQSMLSQKIQSEIEDEDEVADADEMAHEEGEDHDEEEAPEVAVEPEEGEEEDEIASDEMSHEGEDHDEVEDEDEMAHEVEDEDEGYDESKVIEIDGVKYAPVVSEEEEDEDEAMHEEEDEDEGYSEDLDLEAVLAELEGDTVNEEEEDEDEGMKEGEEKEDKDEVEEEVNENDVSSEIGASDNKLKPEAGDSSKIGQGPEGEGKDKESGKEDENLEVVDDLTEDLDLEEVLKALTEEEDEDEMKKEEEEKDEKMDEEVKSLRADIEEHRNVVKYLRGKLNEVNLLNAKLLFTNKLFRNFGLSNEQKLKVVETFDRATNLREVKLVFSTLAESFGNKVASKPSKKQESKGSSSKPVASTKPKTEEVISEGFDMKERFQKLAKIL